MSTGASARLRFDRRQDLAAPCGSPRGDNHVGGARRGSSRHHRRDDAAAIKSGDEGVAEGDGLRDIEPFD